MQLEGKVAIVTGGGRGIGRSESLALAAAGAIVVVNDLGTAADGTGADRAPADEVVAAICEAGGEAVVNYGDVSQLSTGAELVSQALDTYGRLDILVNNAGILRPTPFLDLTEEDWDVLISTHLRGHFSVAQAAAKIFVEQSSGRLVNTSSEAGLGMPLFANYGSAKEGITGLTRTLALELAPYRVTVNQIRPRSSNTRMYTISVESGQRMGASLIETLPGATDQGLFARPEDFHTDRVASLVVFLCTDAAAGITNGDSSSAGARYPSCPLPNRWPRSTGSLKTRRRSCSRRSESDPAGDAGGLVHRNIAWKTVHWMGSACIAHKWFFVNQDGEQVKVSCARPRERA